MSLLWLEILQWLTIAFITTSNFNMAFRASSLPSLDASTHTLSSRLQLYELPTGSPVVLACLLTLPCFEYQHNMSACFPQPSPLHLLSPSSTWLTPVFRLSTVSPKPRSPLWVFPSSLYHDTTNILLGLCFKCFLSIHLSYRRDCELPVASNHIHSHWCLPRACSALDRRCWVNFRWWLSN